MKRSKGFTLVELLVVVAIIAMLVGILMPTLSRAKQITQVAVCAASLNAIGKGIKMHETEAEEFPLLWTDATSSEMVGDLDENDDKDDIADIDNKNAMNNVWALIKKKSLQEEHFKCPADADYKDRDECETAANTAPETYGWNDRRNFSYGIHKPNNNSGEALLTVKLSDAFPIFADKNYHTNAKGTPRRVAGKVYYKDSDDYREPSNHPADGFNLLTKGATCKKITYSEGTDRRFSSCGINSDDIYLAQDDEGSTGNEAQASVDPENDKDTFILPWKEGGGAGM